MNEGWIVDSHQKSGCSSLDLNQPRSFGLETESGFIMDCPRYFF